jgi:hypothetical protein
MPGYYFKWDHHCFFPCPCQLISLYVSHPIILVILRKLFLGLYVGCGSWTVAII